MATELLEEKCEPSNKIKGRIMTMKSVFEQKFCFKLAFPIEKIILKNNAKLIKSNHLNEKLDHYPPVF